MKKYRVLEPDGVKSNPLGIMYCVSSFLSSFKNNGTRGYWGLRTRPEPRVLMEFYLDREPTPEEISNLEMPWEDGFGNPVEPEVHYRLEEMPNGKPEKEPEKTF